MATENIVSKKFRILVDKSQHLYERISFWTRASDVEFNSGKNAQDTLGNIYGISDSLTSTSSNIAASTAAVKAINDKITNVALGDATQADVLAGKTFSSSAGITKTGTMSNLNGAVGYSNIADGTTFARIVLGNTGKITQGSSYVDVPCDVLKNNVSDLGGNFSIIYQDGISLGQRDHGWYYNTWNLCTIPSDGTYMLLATRVTTSGGGVSRINFYKNSSTIYSSTTDISTKVELKAGDQISMYAACGNNSGSSANGGGVGCTIIKLK